MNYQELGKVTDKFMAALKKRKEVKGLFTFFASNYPQYEIVINNDVAMQKGVSIADAMNNLSIVVGSTWEQGFVRFGQFFKVYVQASPEFRRFPEDFDNLFVKNDKGGIGSLLLVHAAQEEAGLERDQPLQPLSLRRHPRRAGERVQQRSSDPGDQGGRRPDACLAVTTSAGKVSRMTRRTRGTRLFISWDRGRLRLSGAGGAIREFLAAAGGDPVAAGGALRDVPVPAGHGLSNDVYAQIGLVMLVGLLGKNAILIVEFAVQRRDEGLSLREAAIEGGNCVSGRS